MRISDCGINKKDTETGKNGEWERGKGWTFFFSFCILEIYAVKKDGRLAQLVRAPVSHTGGRGFNSLTAYQSLRGVNYLPVLLFGAGVKIGSWFSEGVL